MHDRNGTPLKLGDRVLLEATIVQLHPTEDFCNVNVRTPVAMPAGQDHMRTLTTNTRNCALLERAPEAAPEPAPTQQ